MLFVIFKGEIFGGNAVLKLICTIALVNCLPMWKKEVLLSDNAYKNQINVAEAKPKLNI